MFIGHSVGRNNCTPKISVTLHALAKFVLLLLSICLHITMHTCVDFLFLDIEIQMNCLCCIFDDFKCNSSLACVEIIGTLGTFETFITHHWFEIYM